MAKGIHVPTPHHTTARAAAPMDMVHIDTAGPYQKSIGGSNRRLAVRRHVRGKRFPPPAPVRDPGKKRIAFLGVKHFVVDIGVLRAVWTDNGLRIRREQTTPYKPQ